MSCCDGGMWCDIIGSTGIVLVEYWWLMVLCHAGLKTGSPIWITGLPIWINGTWHCMTVIIDWSHNWSAWKQTEAKRAPSPEGLQACWYICGVARTVVTVTSGWELCRWNDILSLRQYIFELTGAGTGRLMCCGRLYFFQLPRLEVIEEFHFFVQGNSLLLTGTAKALGPRQ